MVSPNPNASSNPAVYSHHPSLTGTSPLIYFCLPVTAPTANVSIRPEYNFMTWQTGSPQITPLSSSSDTVCATTPSSSLSATVLRSLGLAFGSPLRNTMILPGELSVPGGRCHTGLPLPSLLLLSRSLSDSLPAACGTSDILLSLFLSDILLALAANLPFFSPPDSQPPEELVTDGAGLAYNSNKLFTYALSALGIGSPSFTNVKNRLFLSSALSGLFNGNKLTGGVPNVTQCTLLKHPVNAFNSLPALGDVDSICAYNKLATAPPAECPVISRLYAARPGSSSSNCRSRAATGFTILRATAKKPAWHEFPASSRKPSGDAGAVLRLTAQSMKVAEPRMAKTMVFMWSMGTDLMTIAFVPVFQSAETWASRSAPLGWS
ncbi:hypothetical protein CNYM01_10372 [Colletotrichum nymphaeae SA-01]|uniref:Uncharacterized protein n=1 Tax=Colletotrichum nymphaeae SA-01 TaxID=1460502 RepID=A0A135USX9_9PEZI|nr:hypothetical protein CNYM01_10372 [Colletotrichum nymphaeae SA-01]